MTEPPTTPRPFGQPLADAPPPTRIHPTKGTGVPQQPQPQAPHDAPSHGSVDARVDAALADALKEVLDTTLGSDAETFSDLGGDSLRAVRVLSACWRALGVELPIQALKPATRLGDFRDLLRKAVAETGHPGTAPEDGGPARPGTLVPRPERGAQVRLSPAQEGLYSFYRAAPDNAAYNVPLTLCLDGDLNPARLRTALEELTVHHPALRTAVADGDGRPMAQVREPAPLDWDTLDLTHLPDGVRAERVEHAVRTAATAPLDLARSPLRARLLHLASDSALLVLVLHHIVCDEWSLRLLVEDLLALYDGARPEQPRLDALDVAAWERSELTGERRALLADHWRTALSGLADVLELPTDRPRPTARSFLGDRLPVEVDAASVSRLRELAHDQDVTLFTVLAAACALTLQRHTGQDDFALGFPVAGRTRPEFDRIVGYFTKTIPLPVRLSSRPTVAGLLARLHEDIARAQDHAQLPFEEIADAIGTERQPGVPPLIQCALVLYSDHRAPTTPEGLDVTVAERGTGTSKFDLNWYLDERDGKLTGYIEYATDLFDRATVERLHGHFLNLLASLAAAPPTAVSATLPMLAPAERTELLDQAGRADSEHGIWEPVHRMFERWAATRPDHAALWHEGEHLTYRELNARANAVAHTLREKGLGAEDLIGIHIGRSPDQMVALLAVLKAGAAYLPLDPAYPADRLSYMVRDAALAAVITSDGAQALAEDLGAVPLISLPAAMAGPAARNPEMPTAPDRLAYVIYTSGTTGCPKGVEITHRSLANVITSSRKDFGIDGDSRVLQVVSFNFDASVWEIFMALSCGATLCLGPRDVARAEQGIEEVIRASGATLVYLPPALLSLVDPAAVPGVETAITGGDLVTEDLRRRWNGRCRFFVAYGPTEGTIVQTWQEHDARVTAALPIGEPFDGVRLYVLDGEAEPVPVGAVGEVHIGGVAVSRGYRGRPALTAERYLPDPHSSVPGARMYRTGDRVRRLPGGELTFVGRTDHQVKVRGYRIEPAEVEAALLRLDGVETAVALAETGPHGRAQLVAYIVTPGRSASVEAELREALKAMLPDHMVPTRIHHVPTVPLTANGKVDRKALPKLADIDNDLLAQLLEHVEDTI